MIKVCILCVGLFIILSFNILFISFNISFSFLQYISSISNITFSLIKQTIDFFLFFFAVLITITCILPIISIIRYLFSLLFFLSIISLLSLFSFFPTYFPLILIILQIQFNFLVYIYISRDYYHNNFSLFFFLSL